VTGPAEVAQFPVHDSARFPARETGAGLAVLHEGRASSSRERFERDRRPAAGQFLLPQPRPGSPCARRAAYAPCSAGLHKALHFGGRFWRRSAMVNFALGELGRSTCRVARFACQATAARRLGPLRPLARGRGRLPPPAVCPPIHERLSPRAAISVGVHES
jgi:hypothetical protein